MSGPVEAPEFLNLMNKLLDEAAVSLNERNVQANTQSKFNTIKRKKKRSHGK